VGAEGFEPPTPSV